MGVEGGPLSNYAGGVALVAVELEEWATMREAEIALSVLRASEETQNAALAKV